MSGFQKRQFNGVNVSEIKCFLLDWGDTVMRVFPEFEGSMASWPKVEVIPGVSETLKKIHPQFTIALGTNAVDSNEQSIWDALRRGGIAACFHKIYCFEKTQVRKPSPDFYHFIMRDLDLKPSQLLFISDSFEQDILSASLLDIPGLWFNEKSDENHSAELYHTIYRFSDLLAFLDIRK